MYLYGGTDGSCYHSSLHQLDTRSWTWKRLLSAGPMRKRGCGLVAHDSKLVLFGGFGIPSGPTQPGAEFTRSNTFTDGSGRTNEVHTFDLKEGEGVRVGFTSHVTTKFPYGTWFSQLPLAQCHIIILYLQHWPCLSFHTVEHLEGQRMQEMHEFHLQIKDTSIADTLPYPAIGSTPCHDQYSPQRGRGQCKITAW